MKSIGIFYGSSSGTTENIANAIADKLGVASTDIHNVADASPEDVNKYEVLILGSSTWGAGDLQDDWFDYLPKIAVLDLTGKIVALFGCGDSGSFSDTFCDAMGTIHNELAGTGCRFIGEVDSSEYSFDASTACTDGKFVGLALDEVNEDSLTEGRIDAWLESIKKEIG